MGKNLAIIFAGGSGARMGSGLPKQFIEVNGKPIIIHTLELFDEHPLIDEIYIACKEDYIEQLERMIQKYCILKVKRVVPGGKTGQDSIYNALCAAYENHKDESIVLIHDGVRPYVTNEVISENIRVVKEKGSAITCSSLFETPVISKGGENVDEVPERSDYFLAQAPQSFFLKDVLEAHIQTRRINPEYEGIVDTCSLMRTLNKKVAIVKGNRGNIKVTTPEDLYTLRGLFQYREMEQIFGFNEKEVPMHLKK